MTTDFPCESLIRLGRQKPANVRCTGSKWRMVERIGTRYREYCRYRRDDLQAARQETETPGGGSHRRLMLNWRFCFLRSSVTRRTSFGSLRLRSMCGGGTALGKNS